MREIGADDAAIQLAYAQHVIIVPGYGLAVAQAQHAVRELAELLEERGVDVKYAIHPVAGRMPGHMNVLLAEANVPYPQLKEMDDINPEFDRADVALVIGANDVTNPAARRPGSPVSGMPILDVDHAKSIVVIKRSMGQRLRRHRQRAVHRTRRPGCCSPTRRTASPRSRRRSRRSSGGPRRPARRRTLAAHAATQAARLAPRPAKIAFIGSHGIRKTSALLAFAAEAQRAGRSVELGREVVRDNPLGINEGATGEAQLWVLVTQIRQELELARRADILATDRGVMDNFAYYLRSCGGDGRVRRRSRWSRRWSATYDLVVRLLPDVALQADGVRSTNDAFRDEVEAILDDVLPGLVAGRPAGHGAGVRDHEPVRLVRGAAAAGDGRSAPRSPHPTSGADARYRPIRRARYQASAGASRSAADSASAVTAPSSRVDREREPGLPVVARPRRTSRSSRPSPAVGSPSRIGPNRARRRAQRPLDGRDVDVGAGDQVRGPGRDRRPRPTRRIALGELASAPATGRATARQRRAAGSAAVALRRREELESAPSRARRAATTSRWAGESETLRPAGVAAERAQVGRDPLGGRAPRVARLVEVHVHRERRVGDGVVPALEQALHDRPQRLDRRASAAPAGAGRRRRGRGPAAARRPRGGPARSGGCRGR